MRRLVALTLLLLTACAGITRTLLDAKKKSYRDSARLTEQVVEVSGQRIVYLDRGGAGFPMLLVHGFGGDKDNWTLFAAHVPDGHRVIALDLPGFGKSTRDPAASYDVKSQAARLLAFADALHLSRFDLAGNSMGGEIAAQVALEHPERVRTLGLFDAAGVRSPHPSFVETDLAAGRNPLLVSSADDFDRLMHLTMSKPPSIPGFVKSYFAEQAVKHRAFNDKVFRDLTVRPDDLERQLPRLRVPTLVVWGDSDRVIDPSAAEVFARDIPGAKLVVLPRCGHIPMLEYPKKAAKTYVAFVDGR